MKSASTILSKSRLLATFNCKMVAINQNNFGLFPHPLTSPPLPSPPPKKKEDKTKSSYWWDEISCSSTWIWKWAEQRDCNTYICQRSTFTPQPIKMVERERIEKLWCLEAEVIYYKVAETVWKIVFNIILVHCSAQKHISFEVRLKCYKQCRINEVYLHEICSSWLLLILGVCVFGSYRIFWFPLVYLIIWPSIDKFSWISFHIFLFKSVGRRLANFFESLVAKLLCLFIFHSN